MTKEGPGDDAGQAPRVNQLDRVKQEYTAAARQILARSMAGVARTKLTPDMLTVAGLALCLAGAVFIGFEYRNEKLFFWLGGILFVAGSISDILDGALARAASKGTVFGAFLDSTFDRVGEAAVLTAVGLAFTRDGNDVALVATFAAVIGSFLVSYTRARAESLGLRGDVGFGSRVERVVIISVGLFFAPWGWLQWPIYLLAAMAWITVLQRMLFVRRQLRELAEQTETGVETVRTGSQPANASKEVSVHGYQEADPGRPQEHQAGAGCGAE
jgi:phosphatidylglycerophosphate synthase